MPSAIGSKTFLIRVRESFEMVIGLAYEPEGGALPAANSSNASSRRRQIVSRPWRRVSTTPVARRRVRCQDDERLGQPDVVDQLGHGGVAVREPTQDAQPVHVRHDLVERAQLAQVVRLDDGGGDRAADSGGGGGHRGSGGWGRRASHQRRFISMPVDAMRPAWPMSRGVSGGDVRSAGNAFTAMLFLPSGTIWRDRIAQIAEPAGIAQTGSA